MIPDVTMGQLFEEAEERWGEIWDMNSTRMRILLLCLRKDRKMMELHGDLVEHGQPVVSMFHRPRAGARLLEEQGLNPRDASFQFVDLATTDLGPWVQHLVKNEGWRRSSISVHPLPFNIDSPAQRAFEAEQVMCFTHPELPAIDKYYLPFPTSSLPGKAFVSLPRRQAAEFARQQAEVLGVGRLQKPKPVEEPVAEPVAPPKNKQKEESQNIPPEEEVMEQDTEEPVALPSTKDSEHVPLPPSANTETSTSGEPQIEIPIIEPSVPIPSPATSEEKEVASNETEEEEVEIVEEEPQEPMSEIEMEFRSFIEEKLEQGTEVSDFMEDPRWEELNERAIAIQLDTWSILVEMTSIG